MLYISDETIDRFIREDIPYIDLTTQLLGIGDQTGIIRFSSREDAVISGTEEVKRLFGKLGVDTVKAVSPGAAVRAGEVFFEAEGGAAGLHAGWKVSLNILEYCSGVATRTRRLVDGAKAVNPGVEIVTTRKVFPGTKELAVKAVLAGGGLPHRLGLSETVLIFRQHLNFIGGVGGLIGKIEEIKTRACEKKVIVETDNREDALRLAKAGVDGIQIDKLPPAVLKEAVDAVRAVNSGILLIGTGGVNESNVAEYAKTGVDSIATTSVYFGKPVDIGAEIDRLDVRKAAKAVL